MEAEEEKATTEEPSLGSWTKWR